MPISFYGLFIVDLLDRMLSRVCVIIVRFIYMYDHVHVLHIYMAGMH